MVKNCGFTEEEAKRVEANYHKMYQVSDQFIDGKLQECADNGYATLAFGLRLRTPLLQRTVLNIRKTPQEAQAEARSVGNALSGQSYGLLNNRACNEFMQRVWSSPYAEDILPVTMIHDAIYLMVRDDVQIVQWVNKNLIECMEWNELPEIQHPEIGLGAELDMHYPNWANAITLPNQASADEIQTICTEWFNENIKKEQVS